MKPHTRTALIVFAASLSATVPACRHEEHVVFERQEAENTPDVRDICGVLRRLEAADTDEDLATVISLYADDVVWLPPDRPVVRGKAEIEKRYRSLFAEHDVRVEINEEELVVSGCRAACIGRTHVDLVPRRGAPAESSNDKFVMLLRREREGWRITHLMWSRDSSG